MMYDRQDSGKHVELCEVGEGQHIDEKFSIGERAEIEASDARIMKLI